MIDPRVEGNCSGHSATSVQQQQEGPRPTRPMLTRAYPPKGGAQNLRSSEVSSRIAGLPAVAGSDPSGFIPQTPAPRTRTGGYSDTQRRCAACHRRLNDSLRRVVLFAVGGKPCVDAAACGRIRGIQSNVSDRVAPGVHAFARFVLHPRLRKPLRSFRRQYGAAPYQDRHPLLLRRASRITSNRPSRMSTAIRSNSPSPTSRAGSALT